MEDAHKLWTGSPTAEPQAEGKTRHAQGQGLNHSSTSMLTQTHPSSAQGGSASGQSTGHLAGSGPCHHCRPCTDLLQSAGAGALAQETWLCWFTLQQWSQLTYICPVHSKLFGARASQHTVYAAHRASPAKGYS